jgi:hypothetical protein
MLQSFSIIRTGGVGISLTAANRVVLIDPDWNPQVKCIILQPKCIMLRITLQPHPLFWSQTNTFQYQCISMYVYKDVILLYINIHIIKVINCLIL